MCIRDRAGPCRGARLRPREEAPRLSGSARVRAPLPHPSGVSPAREDARAAGRSRLRRRPRGARTRADAESRGASSPGCSRAPRQDPATLFHTTGAGMGESTARTSKAGAWTGSVVAGMGDRRAATRAVLAVVLTRGTQADIGALGRATPNPGGRRRLWWRSPPLHHPIATPIRHPGRRAPRRLLRSQARHVTCSVGGS